MADKPFGGQTARTMTPVIDPRTHQVLGYRDGAGRQWTPNGKPATGLPSAGGVGGWQHGAAPQNQAAAQKTIDPKGTAAAKEKAATEAKQKATATAAAALDQAQGKLGYVWVNGNRMKITGQATDGSYTVSYVDSDGKVVGDANQAMPVATAFDALNADSIDPGTQYVMSYGTQTDASGAPASLTPTQAGRSDQSSQAAMRSYANTKGANKMTVQAGVQWLANLSTKDPDAYNHMVDQLHSAGYLQDADYKSAKGAYSSQVASAFAYAARDTAVVNGTAGGENTSISDLLDQKAGNNSKAAVDSYTPVDRTYTDPTAIAAQAKSAAEAAIGRKLTPEEEAKLTGHFRSLEDGAFDQIDSAGRAQAQAKADGTAQAPVRVTQPNATGQIDQFLDSGALEQEQANFAAAGYGEALKKLFGG